MMAELCEHEHSTDDRDDVDRDPTLYIKIKTLDLKMRSALLKSNQTKSNQQTVGNMWWKH